MGERTCTACGAVADHRLKFCRECGGRLEGGDPGAAMGDEIGETVLSPPADAPGDDDSPVIETLVLQRDAGDPVVETTMDEPDDPADDDDGDQTIMGGAVSDAVKSMDEPDDLPEDGDQTIMGGAVSDAVKSMDEPEDLPEDGDQTIMSGAVGDAAAAVESRDSMQAVEPPDVDAGDQTLMAPAPPPVLDDAGSDMDGPVTDDFDYGDNTLMAPSPAAESANDLPGIEEVDLDADQPAASPGSTWDLQHWAPKEDRIVVTLEGSETFVGRDQGDLTYPHDHYLSRSHGRFYTDEEGRLCVEDLGTLNGVFVRVRHPMTLQHRDVLHIGRHVLRFEMLSSEEEDPRTMEGDPFTQVMGVQGSPPRARLSKRQDDGFNGTPFFFGVRKYVLGRSEGTHRFTKDDRMSRSHASLTFQDGEYLLEDLGSQNGTFIQIHAPHVLDRGDVVKMGDQIFKVL